MKPCFNFRISHSATYERDRPIRIRTDKCPMKLGFEFEFIAHVLHGYTVPIILKDVLN